MPNVQGFVNHTTLFIALFLIEGRTGPNAASVDRFGRECQCRTMFHLRFAGPPAAALALASFCAGAQSPFYLSSGQDPLGLFQLISANIVAGNEFLAHEDVLVTRLGVLDFNNDGLETAHPIGIFQADGTLLASATVPSGVAAPFESDYRWVDLPQGLILKANTPYILSAYYPFTGDTGFGADWIGTIAASIDRHFTLLGGGLGESDGLAPPYLESFSQEWGPNLGATEVPEPSQAILIIVGAAAHAGWSKRRKVRTPPRLPLRHRGFTAGALDK